MDFKKYIKTPEGDIYYINIYTVEDEYLVPETFQAIRGIELLTIDLGRVKGIQYTSTKTIAAIVEEIAKIFKDNDHAVFCYYCDYTLPIPHTKKHITPQEYRSALFTRLYERYVITHDISDVNQQVVTVDGGDEKYFIHFIFRDSASSYIPIISNDLKESYSK